MGLLLDELWDIFWTAFQHAVSLQWSLLTTDLWNLVDWFWRFWDKIEALFFQAWEYAQSAFDAIAEAVSDALFFIDQSWSGLGSLLLDQLALVSQELLGQITALADIADLWLSNAYYWVYDLVRWILALAWQFISPLVDAVRAWVIDAYGWIKSYQTLITGWLVSVKEAIDWIIDQWWLDLESFLADPLGFVLGELGTNILSVINWWVEWGESLADFMTVDLPAIREFLATGLALLQTFLDDPLQMILDILTPIFLDWLENLIEENW